MPLEGEQADFGVQTEIIKALAEQIGTPVMIPQATIDRPTDRRRLQIKVKGDKYELIVVEMQICPACGGGGEIPASVTIAELLAALQSQL